MRLQPSILRPAPESVRVITPLLLYRVLCPGHTTTLLDVTYPRKTKRDAILGDPLLPPPPPRLLVLPHTVQLALPRTLPTPTHVLLARYIPM